jgi:hypothetical protein
VPLRGRAAKPESPDAQNGADASIGVNLRV